LRWSTTAEKRKSWDEMHFTKLLIFGSPKADTPLMLAALSSAIDLLLKILITGKSGFRTTVRATYLNERHDLPQELLQNIAVVETLAAKAGE
jgi:uncharacterized protein (DUF302 family)